MTPPKKAGSTGALRKRAPRKGTIYEPIRPEDPKTPQTKVSFEIPRRVHQRLLEITRTSGISQEEIFTEALYEWLLSNGKADVAALLAGKSA